MKKKYRIIDVETLNNPRNAGVVTVEGNILSFSDDTYRSIIDISILENIPFVVGVGQNLEQVQTEPSDIVQPSDPDLKENEKQVTGTEEYNWESAEQVVLVASGEQYYFQAFKEWLMKLDFVLEEIE